MARSRDVPDLLEKFMEKSGETQCWITVNEIRTYFDLDEFSSPAISGFLRRIYYGQFLSCPYRVERIEKITVKKKQQRVIKRYLVTKRPQARKRDPALHENSSVIDDSREAEKGYPGADAGITGNEHEKDMPSHIRAKQKSGNSGFNKGE